MSVERVKGGLVPQFHGSMQKRRFKKVGPQEGSEKISSGPHMLAGLASQRQHLGP